MSVADCDVAVVGAGPYGLATTSHLHAANGLDIRLFGRPMTFWSDHMPQGMLLRSPYVASNIADPARERTLDDYGAATSEAVAKPVPLDRFVEYGRWFQQTAFPDLDERHVADLEVDGSVFRLELEDGEALRAKRVIVAAGIQPFARRPTELAALPPELVSHCVDHRSLTQFAGRRVVVVGGGQSALESAALLHEGGAAVEVLVRQPRIYYLRRVPRLHRLGPVTRLLFAPAEVGPAGVSQLVSAPLWFRRLPRRLQTRFTVRSLRPAGAAWLEPRLVDVPMTLGARVVSAREHAGGVEVALADGTKRTCDHVLLATGYEVDIARYPFMGAKLLSRIERAGGYPKLDGGYQSSVPRLHFMGAPSAWTYGPLMRFVAGTEFAAPVLTRAVLGANGHRH